MEPKVLLLDEPLSAIDALLQHNLQVEIRKIQQEMEITAIFVTHDQDEAMVMSDVIHLMKDGRIEQSSAPAELYTRPESVFAASFIGHYNVLPVKSLEKACKETITLAGTVAFRPEIVSMSYRIEDIPDAYYLHGMVGVCLPHGNFIRYAVICDGIQVDVDMLFNEDEHYKTGERVKLYVKKNKCVYLDG